MTKKEIIEEFGNLVEEFLKSHKDELNRDVIWKKMPDGMFFGAAELSSNDFVLCLLRSFRDKGARIVDGGVWSPFPNFAFPKDLPEGKLNAEESVDWDKELG